MAKSNSSTSLHNQGENRGIMASEIHGPIDNSQHTTIIYSERETQKKLPSLIPQIVETLAEITVLSDDEIDKIYRISKEELTSYNIDKKITHNNLILYK